MERHGDPAEGVSDDEVLRRLRQPGQRRTPVLDAYGEAGAEVRAQALDRDLDHAVVDLRDQVPGARAHLVEVARHGQAPGTEVVGVERVIGGEGGVDHRGDGGRVVELEVGRVVEVDVGVAESVEHEQPPGGAFGVHLHDGAVVGGLDVAAAGQDRRGETGDGHDRRGARRAAPAAQAQVDHDGDDDEHRTERQQDRAHRQQ